MIWASLVSGDCSFQQMQEFGPPGGWLAGSSQFFSTEDLSGRQVVVRR